MKEKKKKMEPPEPPEPPKLTLLDLTDEQVKNSILESLENVSRHEAGTAWMKVGTLLSGNSTDQMLGAGFKVLIDQNKVIYKQNILIMRLLEQILEKAGHQK
jgi:hypothetical protein